MTGIGASNLINVAVDADARVKVDELRKELQRRLDAKIPVYAVVAVIGTTEEGAVDPLDEIVGSEDEQIVGLKEEFRRKGMSFIVHADAACRSLLFRL